MKRYTREEIEEMKEGRGKPASPRGALARANSLLSKAQDALGHVATAELRQQEPEVAARIDRVFEHIESARRAIMHRLPSSPRPAQKAKAKAKTHKPAGKMTLGAVTDRERMRLERAIKDLNLADVEDVPPFDRFKAAMAEAEEAARGIPGGEQLQILNRGRGQWFASWVSP